MMYHCWNSETIVTIFFFLHPFDHPPPRLDETDGCLLSSLAPRLPTGVLIRVAALNDWSDVATMTD